MSNILNRFLCIGQGVGNTGNPDCQFVPANITGAILVPSSVEYTATQAATLDTVLVAAAKVDNAASRVYPIKRFRSMSDNSTDDTTNESGYGDITKMRSGKPVWQFELQDGLYSWSQLKAFDNQETQWSALFMDEENNVVWGKGTSSGGFAGFPLNQLSVSTPKMNDGSNPFNYMITFGLKSVQDLQNFSLVQFDDSIAVMDMVDGLVTVQPTIVSGATDTSTTLQVRLLAAGTNMFTLYESEFVAGGGTEFLVSVDGAAGVAATGCAATGGGADTFDITVAALSAAEVITVTLAAPSVLEAASVPGYESATSPSVTVV